MRYTNDPATPAIPGVMGSGRTMHTQTEISIKFNNISACALCDLTPLLLTACRARIMCILAVLILGFNSAGGLAADYTDDPVNAGIAAYETGDYKEAVKNFKRAIQSAPDTSFLHHWLGKCYGRIAENVNWFKAMSYAKKTLKQFRKAVDLDVNNREALRDLVDYLETAPVFLGGNKREAKHLRQQLEQLQIADRESL